MLGLKGLREFGIISTVDHYLYSQHLSALKCIDTVRRSYIGITSGSERVKHNLLTSVSLKIIIIQCISIKL